MDIKEMRKDILEYDLYHLLDGVAYGRTINWLYVTKVTR